MVKSLVWSEVVYGEGKCTIKAAEKKRLERTGQEGLESDKTMKKKKYVYVCI